MRHACMYCQYFYKYRHFKCVGNAFNVSNWPSFIFMVLEVGNDSLCEIVRDDRLSSKESPGNELCAST